MRRGNLAALILQDITHRALQNPGTTTAVCIESGRMLAQATATPAGFDADHSHRLIAQERMKQSDRIRSAADAGNQTIRQTVLLFQDLRPRFPPDHALKIAHHQRIRMRSQRAAQQIISIGNIRHPVAQRFIDRILQGLRSGIDFAHFGAEQLHAEHIQRLTPHVFRSHVNDAL